ncbi:MAG TPA: ABC transporter permease [Candidatus Limnocylindria bacterium]|nr:ABC transporter permease [Candidatus Limnocylindria bacterium]
MLQYTIRRLLLMIPTLFFVAALTFGLAKAAPGSPFDRNPDRPPSAQTMERLNRYYGLDKPVHEQFFLWLGNMAKLDLGSSLVSNRPIADILGRGFPITAQLGLQALLLALAVSLPLGVISALRQNTLVDYGSLFFATIGTTIPSFVIALFFIYVFGVWLRWLPFVGWGSPQHMIMPTIILSLGSAAFLTRITRASMLEAIRQDYVRTARSKGLREQVVIVGHVLKNAMIPVATILGPAAAGLITGSFIIESLFSVPGIGREYIRGIVANDYPLIMATTLLYAFFIVVANLSVDLVYGMLDPRIKVGK